MIVRYFCIGSFTKFFILHSVFLSILFQNVLRLRNEEKIPKIILKRSQIANKYNLSSPSTLELRLSKFSRISMKNEGEMIRWRLRKIEFHTSTVYSCVRWKVNRNLEREIWQEYLKSAVEKLHFALLYFFFPPLFFAPWIAFRKSAAIIDVPGCPVRRSWCAVTMNNLVACVYVHANVASCRIPWGLAGYWRRKLRRELQKLAFVSAGAVRLAPFSQWSCFLHANKPRVFFIRY